MHMNKPVQDGDVEIVYQGKIVEVVKTPMKIGEKKVSFESARRAPGVRLLFVRDRKILMSREYRSEIQDYDYRLPGGKVFDTLEEYNAAPQDDASMAKHAEAAAIKEAIEEVGLVAKNLQLIHISHSGATVVWNLFYFVIEDFEEGERELEDGEVIEPEWKTFEEAEKLCLDGSVKEDRSAAVLLRFLATQ